MAMAGGRSGEVGQGRAQVGLSILVKFFRLVSFSRLVNLVGQVNQVGQVGQFFKLIKLLDVFKFFSESVKFVMLVCLVWMVKGCDQERNKMKLKGADLEHEQHEALVQHFQVMTLFVICFHTKISNEVNKN